LTIRNEASEQNKAMMSQYMHEWEKFSREQEIKSQAMKESAKKESDNISLKLDHLLIAIGEYKSEVAEVRRKGNSTEDELRKTQKQVEDGQRKISEELKRSSDAATQSVNSFKKEV
jgi:hypothetical protein